MQTGEFVNVTWLPMSGDAPPYITKLTVAALKTLQASYDGAERYDRKGKDHWGNDQIAHYHFIGMLGDSSCWQMDANSISFDQANEESRKICWSPNGGVVQSTTGDIAEIGTADSPSTIVEKVVYHGQLVIVLSDNGTVSVQTTDPKTYDDKDFLEFWRSKRAIDVGRPWMPLATLNSPFFIIDDHGVLYAEYIDSSTNKWSQVSNYNNQPVPFQSFCGGSSVLDTWEEIMIWAIDYKGAIWGSGFRPAKPATIPWKNYTDSDTDNIALQALQVGSSDHRLTEI